MKIARQRLAEIIREEIQGLFEFSDGSDEPKKSKKKAPADPGVASADTEPSPRDQSVPDGGSVKSADASPVPPAKGSGRGPDPTELDQPKDGPAKGAEETGDDPEASDDEEDALDADGDAGEEPSGAVNDEVSGKTVQAITIEPRSKVLPGAKEVVVAFNESTDALRILVTETGEVKFFWRNQLHDLP